MFVVSFQNVSYHCSTEQTDVRHTHDKALVSREEWFLFNKTYTSEVKRDIYNLKVCLQTHLMFAHWSKVHNITYLLYLYRYMLHFDAGIKLQINSQEQIIFAPYYFCKNGLIHGHIQHTDGFKSVVKTKKINIYDFQMCSELFCSIPTLLKR